MLSCHHTQKGIFAMTNPTALEQLTLEYINLLRTDPGGEYARTVAVGNIGQIQSALTFFGVNMTALQNQLNSLTAAPPLAWNGNLTDAARTHNAAMIAADTQSHQLPGEPGLSARVEAAGYTGWSALGENIYAYSSSAFFGHAGFVVDWGYDTEDFDGQGNLLPDWKTRGDGIQDPAGHRINLMSTNFTEIGIGITIENDPATDVGTHVTTHDLGNRFNYQAQFLGVIINDTDNDDFYDVGEGMGGITVTLTSGSNSYTTTSWESGGWQITVPAGNYTITFSGGGLNGSISRNATLGTVNVKIDVEAADAAGTGGTFTGTNGNDDLSGSDFNDVIRARGGDDILRGLGGNDQLFGDSGNDTMRGGAGDDNYRVQDAGDLVIELADEGMDTVRSGVDFTLSANVERLFIAGGARVAIGNNTANTIVGSGGSDTIDGKGGNDVLRGSFGRDTILGGNGSDVIDGGEGKDTMTGGASGDIFQFRFLRDLNNSHTLADTITDFSKTDGDKINLSAIDANSNTGGNQSFEWIATNGFSSTAGEMRYAKSGGDTYIEGDINGDGVADLVIRLTGLHDLTASDVIGSVDNLPNREPAEIEMAWPINAHFAVGGLWF
jgi:Ca2+-binding RTX toxin-like protein